MMKTVAVKAIAGLKNTNLDHVLAVVAAAEQAQVWAVDVAADAAVLAAVRPQTTRVLFASAVEPKALLEAARLGADVLELGNFDYLYEQDCFFTADEVLRLTQETVALLDKASLSTPLSVTIPGHLSVDQQQALAKALTAMPQVAYLQTEGVVRKLSARPQVQPLTAAEKAQVTTVHVQALAPMVSLPVIAASGMCADTVAAAVAAGASVVGVGAALTALTSQAAMVDTLVAIQNALALEAQRAVAA